MYIKTLKMLCFVLLASCSILGWASAEECPYEQLSPHHSFCRKPNLSCQIRHSGVSQHEIQEILKVHNLYRSGVALGMEKGAIGGTLPTASDMMQMVWDDELAAIAQKWADNCVYQHDCRECRAVDDYPVGQNIAYQDWLCSDLRCTNAISERELKPEWAKVLKDFYDEVKDFDKRIVNTFQNTPGRVIGHFTQMTWAQTWRVGCGFTVFKTGLNYRRFYVCNYGPAGNIQDKPLYKPGLPCSTCPVNSCCGPSCNRAVEFPGLCKMLDPNTAPVYPRNLESLLFYCDFQQTTYDCGAKVAGLDKWAFKSSHQGHFTSIVLNGGESSTLAFKNKIRAPKNNFCVRIVFRKGALKAGDADQSHFTADFSPTKYLPVHMDLSVTSAVYMPFNLDLKWRAETKFSLTFSVENNARPQRLDIQEIIAYEGRCDSRTF